MIIRINVADYNTVSRILQLINPFAIVLLFTSTFRKGLRFNALESAVVIEARKGEAGGRELDLLLHRARIEIISLNGDPVELALTAWRKYGKGNHPAGLNIGDCCAYALAKYTGEPLLFKGKDFSQTDIQTVIDK